LTREELRPIRDKLLAPFGLRFDAPNKVALYLIDDHGVVIENFNDDPVTASLTFPGTVALKTALVLPVDGKAEFTHDGGRITFRSISARTLVALTR
jgi:hypothetical protein